MAVTESASEQQREIGRLNPRAARIAWSVWNLRGAGGVERAVVLVHTWAGQHCPPRCGDRLLCDPSCSVLHGRGAHRLATTRQSDRLDPRDRVTNHRGHRTRRRVRRVLARCVTRESAGNRVGRMVGLLDLDCGCRRTGSHVRQQTRKELVGASNPLVSSLLCGTFPQDISYLRDLRPQILSSASRIGVSPSRISKVLW